ncbi:MAG TPA: AAA family ATPase [Streptosporangiaceae bacterium]|nr:AAA family ATPase [Streptosporangiaceae bacterium]
MPLQYWDMQTRWTVSTGGAVRLVGRAAESAVLEQFLAAVRGGESRALVLHGEPGIGKTALLEFLVKRAADFRVISVSGVQSEMELAFAALHQMCAPLLDRLTTIPAPQAAALRITFGLDSGPVPDRLLVGLAVLSLLAEAAAGQPLLCVVDDEQWLDHTSAQVIAFVARRLGAESTGMVFGTRALGDELTGLAQLTIEGLGKADACALLDSVLTIKIDQRVRDQIVAETHGNPLALVELSRELAVPRLAGGFGLPAAVTVPDSAEEMFRRRVEALPAGSRRLLLLAAAEPTGDPVLLWRAAARLGIGVPSARPAVAAGLAEFGARVRFRHPLARSAVYRSASAEEQQQAHAALADATDSALDPDRRAWHRAQAAPGPDEDVAAELENSAGRAQARGGLAAAAAFLERAAQLTPDPVRRAARLLTAAQAKRDAGAPDAALSLLAEAEAEPVDESQAAKVERLRGQIAFDQQRGTEAARLLLSAARRLESFNADQAREAHLESLVAAMWAGDLEVPGGAREAAEAALAAPRGPEPPRAVDAVLDAFALRFTQDYALVAPIYSQVLALLLTLDASQDETGRWLWFTGGTAMALIAIELWDDESWHALATAQVRFARETGALVHLQFALAYLAGACVVAGDLAAAEQLIDEVGLITEATGNPSVTIPAMMLAAWRGQEVQARELIETTSDAAAANGLGVLADFAAYASAVLNNGLGRYDTARDAARRAMEREPGHAPLVVSELAEAAARTGDLALLRATLDWLSERARLTPTQWALGIEARLRAMLAGGEVADNGYRESIERLERTQIRAELARSHLIYGEWLRRERRRGEARTQLRTAQGMFEGMGMLAFAARARRELWATGETARRRSIADPGRLTPQELQIAKLARDGLTNPEIGTRLFISARTVEYHLGKVFAKLGITSRAQLDRALS